MKSRSNAVTWSELPADEIMSLSSKALLEAPTPNDDIWRKFALPLTPPRSPRSYGKSSDSEMISSCIAERLHDVCEKLDLTLDVHETTDVFRNDVKTLRSKLISDCMWSGNTTSDITRYLLTTSFYADKKFSDDAEIELYPTPCPSPPPAMPMCPTSSECVNPTAVFPSCSLSDVPSSGVSDSDEEIDVVTVVDLKPIVLTASKKKGKPQQNIIVHAKVNTCNTQKRPRSSPVKFHITCPTDGECGKKRKLVSVTAVDDVVPDYDDKRATHNVLERKRRIDLKRSFERLRDIIPMGSLKQDKAPKVVVLKRAALYISELSQEEERLVIEKQQLQNENLALVRKLQQLKGLVNNGNEIIR